MPAKPGHSKYSIKLRKNREDQLLGAACQKDIKKARSLIEQGADVNVKNKAGWSPPVFAINKGSLDVTEILI